MAHENEDLMRRTYEAAGGGDLQAVRSGMADDVVFHVPGRNPFSGDHEGWEAVSAFLRGNLERSGGTFRLSVHDILANDDHGVALVRATAQHDSGTLDVPAVHVVHFEDGRVKELWIHPADQYAVDEFWNAT